MGLELLGHGVFICIFVGFFYKCFGILIESSSPRTQPDDRIRFPFLLIGVSAVFMFYYTRWYEVVADQPGVTPVMLAIALGLARYKHRELFKDDDDTSETPTDPSPED